jgi:hypothetical protein
MFTIVGLGRKPKLRRARAATNMLRPFERCVERIANCFAGLTSSAPEETRCIRHIKRIESIMCVLQIAADQAHIAPIPGTHGYAAAMRARSV